MTNLNDFTYDIQDQIGMSFTMCNNFYGGQLGLKGQWNLGRLEAEVTGKVALASRNRASPSVASTFNRAPGPRLLPRLHGFWYAQPSNIGTESRNVFSVVPQVQLKIGYNITANLACDFDRLRFPLLVRRSPATRSIAGSITRSCPGLGPVTGPALPVPFFNSSNFWAQGLNFGLALKNPRTGHYAHRSAASCAHGRIRAGTRR